MAANKVWSAEEEMKIDQLCRLGFSASEMCERFGVTQKAMKAKIDRMKKGVRGQLKKGPRKGKNSATVNPQELSGANSPIVLVGNFSPERVFEFVRTFGADRVRVQP